MVGQRYERVPGNEADDAISPTSPHLTQPRPNSPPPSFHSRASSPTRRPPTRRPTGDVDPTLEDTFGSDNEEEDADDRQRLMRASPDENQQATSPNLPRRTTDFPAFPTPRPGAVPTRSAFANDGVFANMSAKPERGEDLDEKPPTYEQAAADATPPYWETTILAPGMVSDEVYIDGLPVGSFFSFAWNAIISMAFPWVGFLLTYLLHTTHAAKNGSLAGLGMTLINFGFSTRASIERMTNNNGNPNSGAPSDPNSHNFDPSAVSDATAAAVAGAGGDDGKSGDVPSGIWTWASYGFLIIGWLLLIKAVSDMVKARKHEQLILQSPERGLNVPVVAEGETAEQTV